LSRGAPGARTIQHNLSSAVAAVATIHSRNSWGVGGVRSGGRGAARTAAGRRGCTRECSCGPGKGQLPVATKLTQNIADLEVLNEVSQIALKNDFAG
jgi:hypothetical protein